MNPQQSYLAQHPDAVLLELRVSDTLTHYLRKQQWLGADEVVRAVEKPGEGNMNFVARVVTDKRSFIVKQALPWVQRFPQVEAPVARGKMEAIFYQLIEHQPELKAYTPGLIGFDARHHVLALEDLGAGADFTFLYGSSEQITEDQLMQLVRFLSQLHRIKAGPNEERSLPNTAMRQLNHEHIFRYPFATDNGLDLDAMVPGLQNAALPYQQNPLLKKRIAALGDVYLQPGDTLVHGDYYPGSWLRVGSEVKVIDPEFGFFGRAEFDVGVMLAHALLAGGSVYTPERVLSLYEPTGSWDETLAHAFAGVEVLRRLLGLAQLPLRQTLEERIVLLEQAAHWL